MFFVLASCVLCTTPLTDDLEALENLTRGAVGEKQGHATSSIAYADVALLQAKKVGDSPPVLTKEEVDLVRGCDPDKAACQALAVCGGSGGNEWFGPLAKVAEGFPCCSEKDDEWSEGTACEPVKPTYRVVFDKETCEDAGYVTVTEKECEGDFVAAMNEGRTDVDQYPNYQHDYSKKKFEQKQWTYWKAFENTNNAGPGCSMAGSPAYNKATGSGGGNTGCLKDDTRRAQIESGSEGGFCVCKVPENSTVVETAPEVPEQPAKAQYRAMYKQKTCEDAGMKSPTEEECRGDFVAAMNEGRTDVDKMPGFAHDYYQKKFTDGAWEYWKSFDNKNNAGPGCSMAGSPAYNTATNANGCLKFADLTEEEREEKMKHESGFCVCKV